MRHTGGDVIDFEPHSLWILGSLVALTLALNLPFGFLRAKAQRYSLRWFLYIHLPIPFIYLLRTFFSFTASVIPALVVAAVAGQLCGGKIRTLKRG